MTAMKKLAALILVLLIAGAIYWWNLPATVKGPHSEQEFEYIVRITGNGSSSDTLPMIITLHGQGDTPKKFFDTLLNKFDQPARFVVLKGIMDFPGGRWGGRGWPMDANGLRKCGNALADAVPVFLERFPTKGKPIVLGFSSGAGIAYYLAAYHGEQFSYLFPLSGRLPNGLITDKAESNSDVARTIAFHGRTDQVIGFRQGELTVRNLKQEGMDVDFITFNGGHLGIFQSAKPLVMKQLSDAVMEITP
ncbi:MAG TPA: hypothetical protein ENG90_12595 [Gammaproteobacteria bacterium]|nr:hypothetical protein [Gammaproteobacteria bacterium]